MLPHFPVPGSLTAEFEMTIPSVMLTPTCSVSSRRQNNMQRHSAKCDAGQGKPAASGKVRRVKRRKLAVLKEAGKEDGNSF